MIYVLGVVLVVVVAVRARRKRKRMLAGLIATKPTFMVEPPARRLGNRKGEVL